MPRPRKTFGQDEIEKLANALEKAPHKPAKLTAAQAVAVLRPQIEALRQKGYEWKEIKALLAEKGLAVSVAILADTSGGVREKQDDKSAK